MNLDDRIEYTLQILTSIGHPRYFKENSSSARVWKKVAAHVKMISELGIEADDKQMMDWAIQLTQATAVEEIDLSVDFSTSDLQYTIGLVADNLETIKLSVTEIDSTLAEINDSINRLKS
ncbi:MAG TPA: hypothetical protein V6C84_18780 [Coleofasciculaceae cyanobacterium]|jgi:hypothetical protein